MIHAKVKVAYADEHYDQESILVIPITIPEMAEIRQLAEELHAKGEPYEGKAWGWPVSYEPEQPEPPIDSNLTFTPASFTIGVSFIWFVSFTWEYGSDAEPYIYIDDENVVQEQPVAVQSHF